jgi:HlyD family secretion protein
MHPRRMPLYVLVLLLILSLVAGCGDRPPASPTLAPTPGDGVAAGSVSTEQIRALGTVRPAQTLQLGFLTGGPVSAVRIGIGDHVQAGDLLAELDTTSLSWVVREAEEALTLSQALLHQAQTGPSEAALALAQAEVERAQAQHQDLLAGPSPEAIAMAQADVDVARARYEQVRAGASPQELLAAQADLQKAEALVAAAQAAYDQVAGRPDVGASPQAAALHLATIDLETAQARVEQLQALPHAVELAEAQAHLTRAEAALALAQAGPTEAEIAASASRVSAAQAQLALAGAGPHPEDLAVAEARMQPARTALEKAQAALTQTRLLAPFDGVISKVTLRPGEWAAPGAPVVEILDTSSWIVETRNVGELAIGGVRVGQAAAVQVLALGGEALPGHVTAISPVAVVQQGDTTYTLLIALDPNDLPLRPGMNAQVVISTN